jgi:small neutral amino acid transporter SnatA (MarC family)
MKQIKLIERNQVDFVIFVIKKILFIAMLLLTFILADKLTNVIVSTDYNTLNRIINIVLVVVVVLFFRKSKKV